MLYALRKKQFTQNYYNSNSPFLIIFFKLCQMLKQNGLKVHLSQTLICSKWKYLLYFFKNFTVNMFSPFFLPLPALSYCCASHSSGKTWIRSSNIHTPSLFSPSCYAHSHPPSTRETGRSNALSTPCYPEQKLAHSLKLNKRE